MQLGGSRGFGEGLHTSFTIPGAVPRATLTSTNERNELTSLN